MEAEDDGVVENFVEVTVAGVTVVDGVPHLLELVSI